MKKNIALLLLLFMVGASFTSCKEDKDSLSVPVFKSLTFDPPTGVQYGDSLTVQAQVEDKSTPLSTFYTEISYGGAVVYSNHIRTKGNQADLNIKIPLPFAAKALDQTDIVVQFKSINIEGGEASETKTFKAKRPVLGDTLFVKYANGEIVKLAVVSGKPFQYESPEKTYYNNNMNFTISNTEDFSRIIWSWNNNQIVANDPSGASIQVKDFTIKISKFIFDTELFIVTPSGSPMPQFKMNDTQMDLNSDYFEKAPVFVKNIKFEKGQNVSYSGFQEMSKGYNPDFFSFKDGKLTFIAESGTYEVVYVEDWNYLFLTQPEAVFPECLWACGTGMAQPRFIPDMNTSWWDFGFTQAIYFRKISDKVYQATLWLNKSEDWWLDLDFKFYENKNWGGEIGSKDFSSLADIFTTHEKGDIVKSEKFESGYYRLTVDLTGSKGAWTLKAEPLSTLHP